MSKLEIQNYIRRLTDAIFKIPENDHETYVKMLEAHLHQRTRLTAAKQIIKDAQLKAQYIQAISQLETRINNINTQRDQLQVYKDELKLENTQTSKALIHNIDTQVNNLKLLEIQTEHSIEIVQSLLAQLEKLD